ncbi:hypothetical protein [Alteribacillus sp. HJP-4]|uniref:hypothetical protein n=1 Tax=Alteribacillus sp. HJP-4 TaxID=2775394 RepID=UPI0035CD22DF
MNRFLLERPIPDEEIAYITLHFGGWLTKEKTQVETKFRAINKWDWNIQHAAHP